MALKWPRKKPKSLAISIYEQSHTIRPYTNGIGGTILCLVLSGICSPSLTMCNELGCNECGLILKKVIWPASAPTVELFSAKNAWRTMLLMPIVVSWIDPFIVITY